MPVSKIYPKTLGALAIGGAVLSGCFFQGPDDSPAPIDQPIVVSACRDLEPGIKKTADSLVAEGTAKMTADVEYMFSDSVGSWEAARARNPQAALKLFDQALQVAPGHCGATFGRAMASAMMVTQDPKLDAFVKKAEAANTDTSNHAVLKIGSGRSLFKITPDQAAPVLLKLSADMQSIDLPTVTEFQGLVETTLMPKLDSTIAAMEEVLKFGDFAFEFTTQENRTFQIDHGEIGPALAGLKVMKAWLTVAAGYQWELAVDGNYAWFQTFEQIRASDYDHLSPAQTAALDQMTGLFKTGSPFSKVKPAWKAKVKGIPALLLSAVENAQTGLRYAIAEAGKPTGQEHDIYVVGTGTEADVDPADLQQAVDLLERSKKYLTGEVNLSYNKGIRSLKVNFTKIFDVDGAQDLLPYFKFYPYAEWNDTLSADTSWYPYLSYVAQGEMLGKMGYDPDHDYSLWIRARSGIFNNGPVTEDTLDVVAQGGFFTKDTVIDGVDTVITGVGDTVIATLVRAPGKPCGYSYAKEFDRVPNPAAHPDTYNPYGYPSPFLSMPKASAGSLTVSSCRENAGTTEYVSYINAKTKGPIYFTTAAGEKTLDIADLGKYGDDLPALEDKIVFRDPTFAGIFPELTQARIWGVIKSLQTVAPRAKTVCEGVQSPDGFYEYKCHSAKVSDPSDLDLLIETSHLWGGLM